MLAEQRSAYFTNISAKNCQLKKEQLGGGPLKNADMHAKKVYVMQSAE